MIRTGDPIRMSDRTPLRYPAPISYGRTDGRTNGQRTGVLQDEKLSRRYAHTRIPEIGGANDMNTVPAAAIEAATEAFASYGLRTGTASYNDGALHALLNDVLTAAAPSIAAAEREACALIAEEQYEKANWCRECGCHELYELPDLIRSRR